MRGFCDAKSQIKKLAYNARIGIDWHSVDPTPPFRIPRTRLGCAAEAEKQDGMTLLFADGRVAVNRKETT